MTDIAKIQKINEMSAYLKKHGFASSNDEAAKVAEGLFNETLVKAEKGAEKMDSNIGAIERNFEAFRKSANSEIETLKQDLHSVVEKMNEIVKFINILEADRNKPIAVPEGAFDPQPLKKAAKQSTLKTEEKPKNQRVGEFKPGDVSIEDTFYFGNK